MKKYVAYMTLAALIYGCNPSSTRDSKITSLDLKSGNMEYVRSNIEKILGPDSAGQVAFGYIKNYEEELGQNIPKYSLPEIVDEPKLHNSQLVWLYRKETPPTPIQSANKTAYNRFQTFQKSKQLSSEIILDEFYNKFKSSKNITDAKIVIAAGYVALVSGSPGSTASNTYKKMSECLDVLIK